VRKKKSGRVTEKCHCDDNEIEGCSRGGDTQMIPGKGYSRKNATNAGH